MHQIPAYTLGVTLITNDGKVRSFPSLRSALIELGWRWIELNVGAHFCQFIGADIKWDAGRERRTPIYKYSYAIMRSSLGDVITADDFAPLRLKKRPWYLRRFEFWNGEGAVPRTGKRGRGRWHRRLATSNARRAAQVVELCEPPPRPARKASNIPNSWDDYSIAAREDRSWKRHRRTQWKPQQD